MLDDSEGIVELSTEPVDFIEETANIAETRE
jgi:hypothetical protein